SLNNSSTFSTDKCPLPTTSLPSALTVHSLQECPEQNDGPGWLGHLAEVVDEQQPKAVEGVLDRLHLFRLRRPHDQIRRQVRLQCEVAVESGGCDDLLRLGQLGGPFLSGKRPAQPHHR